MKIALHGDSVLPVIGAFSESLRGDCEIIPFSVSPSSVDWSKFDLVIAEGINHPVQHTIRECEKHSIPFLCADFGYIGRPKFWQIGKHLGWLPEYIDQKRFDSLGLSLAPYESGNYILIAGQRANDSLHWLNADQLSDLYQGWIDQIREQTDRRIIFRQHPKEREVFVDCQYDNRSIKATLEDAYCVITLNSTFALDAVIAGVPIFVTDPESQSAPLANTSLDDINDLRIPSDSERMVHLSRVAYAQWTIEEIQSGECLNTILENKLL